MRKSPESSPAVHFAHVTSPVGEGRISSCNIELKSILLKGLCFCTSEGPYIRIHAGKRKAHAAVGRALLLLHERIAAGNSNTLWAHARLLTAFWQWAAAGRTAAKDGPAEIGQADMQVQVDNQDGLMSIREDAAAQPGTSAAAGGSISPSMTAMHLFTSVP